MGACHVSGIMRGIEDPAVRQTGPPLVMGCREAGNKRKDKLKLQLWGMHRWQYTGWRGSSAWSPVVKKCLAEEVTSPWVTWGCRGAKHLKRVPGQGNCDGPSCDPSSVCWSERPLTWWLNQNEAFSVGPKPIWPVSLQEEETWTHKT